MVCSVRVSSINPMEGVTMTEPQLNQNAEVAEHVSAPVGQGIAPNAPSLIKPPVRTTLKTIGRLLVMVFAIIGAMSVIGMLRTPIQTAKPNDVSPAHSSKPIVTTADIAIQDARELLLSRFNNPNSAKFLASKIIDQKDDYYFVQVLVDAQNGFGAMIRSNYCVVIELSPDRKSYFFNKEYSTQECKNPPQEDEIGLIKAFNHWGKPMDHSKVSVEHSLQPE